MPPQHSAEESVPKPPTPALRPVRARLRRLPALLAALAGLSGPGHAADPVSANMLSHKFIMGYQGWFSCPGDPGADGAWGHWFDGGSPTVDMLPDMSEAAPGERCPTPLVTPGRQPIEVFSSRNPATVDRHFRWMREHGIDGVALMRFGSVLQDPASRTAFDAVLQNVRHGAEANGRVFFVFYDISGLAVPELGGIAEDWARLLAAGVTRSPAYLHHRGHPLLGVWGFGLPDRDATPAAAAALLARLRAESAAAGGVTLLGGVPAGWRTGSGDASPDAGWRAVYRSFAVLSPWSVGRYGDDASADAFRRDVIVPDLAETKRLGIDYMPVVFPGFSWTHLMGVRHEAGPSPLNEIPRRCGRFLWRQVFDAVSAGADTLFGAMFDEVDEGTAMFKTAPTAAQSAAGFLTLDADRCRLPSDWYLRLAGAAAEVLHGGRALSADLPYPIPGE